MYRNTEHSKARLETNKYNEEAQTNVLLLKGIQLCLEGINNIEGFTKGELTEMYDHIVVA